MDIIHDYRIKRWGNGYFDINSKGNVTVKSDASGSEGDLYTLASSLVDRGIKLPLLIRFNDILQHRIDYLHGAFRAAIEKFNYRNNYHAAFPIKVNPQFHVIDAVQKAGEKHSIGVEVGSKAELVAMVALDRGHRSFLLCNGYKDYEYISLALIANKLNRNTIIIIEQLYELEIVLQAAKELDIEPQIGLRMKLSQKGPGMWGGSGGEHSKFGLFSHEILECLERLKVEDKGHWLKLLHFHLGSQITTIKAIKGALSEGARMYTELARQAPSLSIFDVGGGLAVDYEGAKSCSDFSMNYTVEEYARDVVSTIGEACLKAGINDPIIITESGRAIVTHHSVLITEVIDVPQPPATAEILSSPPSQHYLIKRINAMFHQLAQENAPETFHNLIDLKEKTLEEFIAGTLNLQEKGYIEKIYKLLLYKIKSLLDELTDPPSDIQLINKTLRETYFCNFSLFQSLPDSWAIHQLFPVMPIHRLNETPTKQAVLVDISCDSDGKIDSFPGNKGADNHLLLHEYHERPYYIGIFLIGAYQEVLGDLHNLFGDTNVVHAELDKNGNWDIVRYVEGDTLAEVLSYVQYPPEKLSKHLHALIEKSIQAGRLTANDSIQIRSKFKTALESYTYLEI